MKTKSIVLIMISLSFGLVAAIGMSQVMGRNQGETDQVETAEVLVALVDLDISQELQPDDVKIESWPVDLIPEGAIGSWEEVENKRLNSRVLEGSTIRDSMLIDRAKFFAFGIPKGFMVHPIRVDQESSFHGLLRPGHRVDVMGIFKRDGSTQKFSRIFLEHVRVFAVNDQTSRSVEEEGRGQKISTVQVLVTRRQAKMLGLAESVGDIKLLMGSELVDSNINDQEVLAQDEADGEEVSLHDLYGEELDDSSVTAADIGKSNGKKPSGILNFLDRFTNNNENEPAGNVEAFEPVADVPEESKVTKMVVITPNGSTEYVWTKRDRMPAIGTSTSMLPPPEPSHEPATKDEDEADDEADAEDDAEDDVVETDLSETPEDADTADARLNGADETR